MRRIDLYFTPSEVSEEEISGKPVVVVDVLRASASIIRALKNGSRGIIPTQSVGEATELAQSLGRENVLLCGERGGKRIDGFDLGNSPKEFTRKMVDDKILIFATTNGSRAIAGAQGARSVLVGSFLNSKALLDYLSKLDSDLAIICAGKLGRFALEDAVAGGMFVDHLRAEELNDGAMAAHTLYQKYSQDIVGMLRSSSHGRYLIKLGYEEDIPLCGRLNSVNLIPSLEEGKLVRLARDR